MTDTHRPVRSWIYGITVGAAVLVGFRMMRNKDSEPPQSSLQTSMDGVKPVKADDKAPPQAPADAVAAARQRLIDAMIQPSYCYMQSLDYAVRDPEFLDAVLAKLLGSAKLAEVALDERELQNLTREAPALYSGELQTADGLLRLERVVAQRFAHPVVHLSGQLVEVDYGHIAAKLHLSRRKAIGIDFEGSPHLLNREWRSTEVAAALKEHLDKHPDADGVQLRVVIPEALIADEFRYSYRRSTDRVLITFPGEPRRPFLSPPLGHDFAPYIRGEKSLATKDLPSVNPSIMQPIGGTEPPIRR